MDFLKPEFCVFCVIIPGLLPFTLWAALRAFKNFPEIFVAAKLFTSPRDLDSRITLRCIRAACCAIFPSPWKLVPSPSYPSLPSIRVFINIGA